MICKTVKADFWRKNFLELSKKFVNTFNFLIVFFELDFIVNNKTKTFRKKFFVFLSENFFVDFFFETRTFPKLLDAHLALFSDIFQTNLGNFEYPSYYFYDKHYILWCHH